MNVVLDSVLNGLTASFDKSGWSSPKQLKNHSHRASSSDTGEEKPNPANPAFYKIENYNRSQLIRYLVAQDLPLNLVVDTIRQSELSIFRECNYWPEKSQITLSDIDRATRPVEPVRYGSVERGTAEEAIWKPFDPRQKRIQMQAVREYLREYRAPASVWQVYQELIHYIDYKTGRLDPTMTRIAENLGRTVRTIQNSLKWLKEHGLIGWIRRFIRCGNGSRSYRQQTSNAYYLKLFGQGQQTPDLPDDEIVRLAEVDRRDEEMVTSLDDEKWLDEIMPAKSGLKESLKKMANHFKQKTEPETEPEKPEKQEETSVPLGGKNCRQTYNINLYNNNGSSKTNGSGNNSPSPAEQTREKFNKNHPESAEVIENAKMNCFQGGDNSQISGQKHQQQANQLFQKGFSLKQINAAIDYLADRNRRKLPPMSLLSAVDFLKKIHQI